MNRLRRNALKEIAVKLQEMEALRDEIIEDLQQVLDEEQEAYDNLSEGIQNSERGDQMQEYIDAMDDILNELEYVDITQWTDTLSEI